MAIVGRYSLFLLAFLFCLIDASPPTRRRGTSGMSTPNTISSIWSSTVTAAAWTSTPSATTAPRVRVVLEHGQQNSVDESSFSNRQPATVEQRFALVRQRKLLNTMIAGHYWEPEWMKISRDEVSGAKRSDNHCILSQQLEEQLNRTAFAHYDKDGNLVELAPAIIEKFKHYLTCMGTCPITYTWEDLGEQFFPRFIRRGFCSNDRPCSWPPGMRCKINQTKTLTIFHHVCDGGDTEISLVNSNSTRLSDGAAATNQRKTNDLRSPRASSANASNARNANANANVNTNANANANANLNANVNASPVEERRNRNQDKRKKRKTATPGNQSNGNGSGNGNGRRNKNNKKKEVNQRGAKRDTLRSVSQPAAACNWQTVSFPVTSQCACSCS